MGLREGRLISFNYNTMYKHFFVKQGKSHKRIWPERTQKQRSIQYLGGHYSASGFSPKIRFFGLSF